MQNPLKIFAINLRWKYYKKYHLCVPYLSIQKTKKGHIKYKN